MRFTIKLKLALTFTVIIALAGAMAWLGVSGLGSINDTMEQMVRGPVQRSLLAADLRVQLLAIIRSEKNLLLSVTPEEISRFDAEILKSREQFVSGLEKLRGIASVRGREILAQISTPMAQWIQVQDKIRDLAQHNGAEEAKKLSSSAGKQARAEIDKHFDEYLEFSRQLMNQAEADAAKQYINARELLGATAAIVLLIATIAGILLSLSIGRGLRRAVLLADAVAVGDLNQ